ncbi:unnamed protein product [Soboliphyme baturini]|uniref:WAPL domain-containing protein n=1 Tax=Soboliphyme baturini TaxID=241478 RepID=A0A183IUR3_9BILA|nr:unnamed protein product [Soboliphyme baturini]
MYNRNGSPKTSRRKPGSRAVSKKVVERDATVSMPGIKYDRASRLFDSAFALESELVNDVASEEEDELGKESEKPVAVVVADPHISSNGEEVASLDVGCSKQHIFSSQNSLLPSSSGAVDSDDRYFDKLDKSANRAHRNSRTRATSKKAVGHDVNVPTVDIPFDRASKLFDAAFALESKMDGDSGSDEEEERGHESETPVATVVGDGSISFHSEEPAPSGVGYTEQQMLFSRQTSLSPSSSSAVDSDDRYSPELGIDPLPISRNVATKDQEQTFSSQGSLTLAVQQFQLVSPASNNRSNALPESSSSSSPKRRQKGDKWKKKKFRGDEDEYDEDSPNSESKSDVEKCEKNMASGKGMASTRVPEEVQQKEKLREYFTVIHNVQQAYQCRQSGETQEFADDVEYLLETMSDASVTVKCLSTLSLLNKCVSSPFRTYLKAHDHVNRFLQILKDSSTDKSLALCTAAFVYMLARDRLSIGINSQSLSVIVELLNFPNDALHDDSDCYGDYGIHRNGVWQALCSWLKEVQRHMGENQRMMFDFTEENLSVSESDSIFRC